MLLLLLTAASHGLQAYVYSDANNFNAPAPNVGMFGRAFFTNPIGGSYDIAAGYVLAADNVSGLVIFNTANPTRPTGAHADFNVAFDVDIRSIDGGDTGQVAFALNYGRLADAPTYGDINTGGGLVISCIGTDSGNGNPNSYLSRVTYRGNLVGESQIGTGVSITRFEASFVRAPVSRLTVTYRGVDHSTGGDLDRSFTYDMPNWDPAQDWRFGLSGSTTVYPQYTYGIVASRVELSGTTAPWYGAPLNSLTPYARQSWQDFPDNFLFEIGSNEGVNPASITVTATSSDESVIPAANLAITAPSPAVRQINLNPLRGAHGTATITLRSDPGGGLPASTVSYQHTVTPNIPPSISALRPDNTPVTQPYGFPRSLPFTALSLRWPTNQLRLEASVENNLVDPRNLWFEPRDDTGINWNLVFTPSRDDSANPASGKVTVKVTDGSGDSASSSFTLYTYNQPLPPAVLGGGTALALNDEGPVAVQARQYAVDANATDTGAGSTATLEAWVFATALPAPDLNVVAAMGTPLKTRGVILAVQQDGSPALANWLNDFVPTNATVKITTNRWHHVASVVNGRAVSLYVDGQISARGTLNDAADLLPKYVYLGHEPFEDNLDRPWFGYLDNVRLWNTARSAADIAANFNRLVPPDAPGLVRDFRCEDGFVHFDGANPALAPAGVPVGGRLQDFSARQRHATLVGFPAFVPGVSPGATVHVPEDQPASFGLGAVPDGTRVWGPAGLKREIYFGPVNAGLQAGLGGSPGWPDRPDAVLALGTGLELPPGGPVAYGQRLSGWLLPPETGNYTFAIASANEAWLWLSSNDSPDNLSVLARSPASGVGFRRFDFNPAQQTATVHLNAGQRYYLEVRHQADNGANGSAHLSVQWTLPSGLVETPIPAYRFQPLGTPRLPADALTFTVEVPPAAGSLTLSNGVATYSPVPNFFGTDSFVYRAAYLGRTSAPVVVNLNVLNRDDDPVAGSGNALQLGDGPFTVASATELNLRGGSFTLELWARRASANPPPANTTQTLWHLAPDDPGSASSQAFLAWQPNGTVGVFLARQEPDPLLLSGTPYLDTDWHHWAVVFDAATGRRELFRDGISLGTDTTTQPPPTFARLHLGAMHSQSNRFQGDLDEVRLWTRARTAGELQATMRTPLTGTETDLLAYYRLDEGNGLTARDSSPPKPGGLTFDLSLVNPVSWTTGLTNLATTTVPRNSPGQRLFLPAFDPDGQTLAWQILSPTPANGRLIPDPLIPGAFTYIPNPNFHGPDPVRYQVTAGSRTSPVATLLVDVQFLPIPPTIAPLRDVELEEEDPPRVLPIVLSDVDDPTGTSLSLTVRSSNPSLLPTNNIAFGGSGNARSVTLNPVPGEVGTATVEIEVSNGALSASASFQVRVNPRLAFVVVNTGEPTSFPSGVATALNQAGQLAGWVAGSAAQTNSQPFLYAGYGTAVPTHLTANLGGNTGGALGINNAGLLVGAAADSLGATRAFLVDPRRDTLPTDLGLLPGGNLSVATAVNDSGLVVGYGQLGDGTFRAFTAGTGPLTALALTNGYAEMWATAVNAAGEIAGYARLAQGGATNAFLHAAGQTRDLGRPNGANHVFVTAVNAGGTVFGHAIYPTGATSRVVRWDAGQWVELGDMLGGGRAEVTGANRYGQIVGRALDPHGVWRAFLYSDGRASDLNALLTMGPGWILNGAAAINDLSQIAANGSQSGGLSQALLLFPATEIGRRVFRPEGTLAELPDITLLSGGGHDQSANAFFWSAGDRKLFAIRPVVAEIRWRTGTYEVVTNLTEFGDTFIRQRFTNEIKLPTLSFNVWPADPDVHVVGTPVQVEPDQPDFQYGFVDLSYTEADGAAVNAASKEFTSPSTGYSVLHYLRTGGRAPNPQLQPHQFRVVRSALWNDPGLLVTHVAWSIGSPVTNALHNDYPGLNGFILFTNAPYDGFGSQAAYDRATRTGPILPVNTHTEGGNLVVVWYRQNPLGVAWSSLPYQYALNWPTNADRIVIASQLGSGPLSPALYPQAHVYHQPDPSRPGFNPNEEHALLAGGVLYALRNDLNARVNPKASDPFVLLKHLDPARGEWRMKPYAVVDEQAPWFFRFDGLAGTEIQPPLPLSTLPLMTQANRMVSGPAWQDVQGRFYARAAGLDGGDADVVLQWFYPLQPDFFYDLDRNGVPDLQPGQPVPWLDRRPGGITGQPMNVTYVIRWPSGTPPLLVGQSLTTATGGLPDIADMAAAQVVFDSMDPNGNRPASAAARLYDPLSPRTVTLEESFTFPDSVRRSVDPTTGLEVFPDLPYVLRVRLFHDPRNRLLGFRGVVYTPPDGGAAITLVNVMNSRERETIAALDTSGGTAFAEVVAALYLKSRNPNGVDLDGDAKPDEALLIGLTMQSVTNNGIVTNIVVRETLLGPKALTAGQPVPPLAPPPAYAVHFNGADAAMQVGPVFTNVTDNFTIEFWVRPEKGILQPPERNDANDARLGQNFAVFPVNGGMAYGGGAGCGVSVGTNGVAVVLQDYYLFAAPLVYMTNLVGWHHVAVVYHQQQPLLYLNGALVHLGLPGPESIRPSADISVSPFTDPGYGSNPGPFLGSLSHLRIWDHARLPSEIAVNMFLHLTGNETGLVGLWPFEENSGTTVADTSPSANPGTLLGGATWTSDAPARAPASRYVVVAENNDPSLAGLPVGLHVLRVDDALARGALALIQPDNVLDERVTLRHTADFAGQPESFVFEWFYQFDAQGFDPTIVPAGDSSGSLTNLNSWVPYPATGAGINDITLGTGGESSLLSLSDTWWVMRYGVATAAGQTNWSGWVGDPAGSAAAPRAMLVPGWIKRVLGGINLFAQRSTDFLDNPVNTLASTIAEAGPRYEGDVALNPDVLDNFGLIEIYETILRRGRSLSIDGTPPVDFPPADQALLLAAGRIADLYLLHANEAFADAADPTVGLTTDSTELGSVASSIFAFENQVDSLIEEELALLRGRDDTSGGVGAAPVYNRLLWNFTGSDGEVAYVATYGIPDQNSDGFINAADARILYPQGHGDAWGHYLSALTTYYDLLRHPNFTWIPRAQSTLVAGIPIQVNYEDERRFALAAAAKARTGVEIADRAWRLNDTADPVAQFRGDDDPNPQRAWSPTDWARRTTLGAYFDWVTGNAILPPTDPTQTGIQRVDRTTVLELVQIVTEAASVMSVLDRADAGLNPAGLARGTVPFDIDPDILRTGFTRVTHFEQVYGRALQALQNAEVTFNRASALSSELRKQQNSVSDYSVAVAGQEMDFRNQLLGIFGYPHAGNLGAGRPFPANYDGPDLTFWMYVDTLDVTPANNARRSEFLGLQDKFTALTTDWSAKFSQAVTDLLNPATNRLIEVEFPVSTADYAFQAPSAWGRRRAEGRLQANLRSLVLAQAQLRQTLGAYEHLVTELEVQADLMDLRYGLQRDQVNLLNAKFATTDTLNAVILAAKTTRIVLGGLTRDVQKLFDDIADGLPGVEGLSVDALAGIRLSILLSGQFAKSVPAKVAEAAEIAEIALDFAKELAVLEIERGAHAKEQNFEVTQRLKELEGLVRHEPGLRLDLFNATQAILQAARDLEATLAEGQRLLVQRTIFRQATAGTIQADRYRDLGLRIFRNDALQKYEAQFNLASRYVHLAAAAYDYELNLGTDAGAGAILGAQIVRERSLGELAGGEPVVGRVGLASVLGRLRQNFDVLKPQLGLNNDRPERTRFSLRTEAFRILPAGTNDTSNASWRTLLQQAAVTNLWDVPEFRRYCRPFAPESAGPQPGLVLRFGTTINASRNFFDQPLGPLDSSYDPSEFATRIRSMAVWLSDYDTAGLAARPRVYLVPVGTDRLRASDAYDFTVHDWQVLDQRIPVPYPLTPASLLGAGPQPLLPSADGDFTELRRHSAFRAYQDAAFDLEEFNETSRLVGRSVWNTQWVLIIPGAYLLGDPQDGIDRLVQSVSDIKLYFQTYSLSGN
ncbi:MAG: hypothetical protein KF833_09655 [Verrucomicrobiae bacterium]|nr:hypothetical protein [Verrucomicrobiae bacterium]